MPSGFHAAAERSLKLAGRNAFLGRAKQMDRLKPEPQRQMAILENRANPNREWLAAGIALAETGARGFALKPPDLAGIGIAAMRASQAIGPKLGFDVIESVLL